MFKGVSFCLPGHDIRNIFYPGYNYGSRDNKYNLPGSSWWVTIKINCVFFTWVIMYGQYGVHVVHGTTSPHKLATGGSGTIKRSC